MFARDKGIASVRTEAIADRFPRSERERAVYILADTRTCLNAVTEAAAFAQMLLVILALSRHTPESRAHY